MATFLVPSGRAVCRPRHGHTLVEILVALGPASVLLAGLASTLYLANRMLDPPAAVRAVLSAENAARQLTDDLYEATFFTERTATAVTFAVPDRDGDGREELIRYWWSGTPGDPLQRAVNGGVAAVVAQDVRQFRLDYTFKTQQESLARRVESAEQKLAEYVVPLLVGNYQISTTRWLGQYLHPKRFLSPLPSGTLAWRPTQVILWVENDGPRDGQSLVQLRRAGSDAMPTSLVLEQLLYPETVAPSIYSPVSFRFQDVWLAPNEGVWIVIQGLTNHALYVLFDHWGGTGRVYSTDGGATWSLHGNGDSLLYQLYGTYVTEGSPQVVRRRFLTGMGVTLVVGAETASRIDTRVALANAPELLAGYWQLDFDRDPTTVDANFDGQADWASQTNLAVAPASLSGGVWQADVPLETRPKYDFPSVTTAEVRFRAVTSGGQGAVFTIHADWSGGTCAALTASVALQPDGTQTLTVAKKTDPATSVPLVKVKGLGSGFVTVRLVIDPTSDSVGVWVQGVYSGLYTYTPFSPGNDDRFARIAADGCQAEFDFVSLRVSEPEQ